MATHYYNQAPDFNQDMLFCLEDYGLSVTHEGSTFYWVIPTRLLERMAQLGVTQLADYANKIQDEIIYVRKSAVAVNKDNSGTHMRMQFGYFLTLGFLNHMRQEDRDNFLGRDGGQDLRLNPNITGRTITNDDLALLRSKRDGN